MIRRSWTGCASVIAGSLAVLALGSALPAHAAPLGLPVHHAYDVRILVQDTPDGRVALSSTAARRLVARVDSWYSAQTNGAYRFAFAGFTRLPRASARVCSMDPGKAALAQLPPLEPRAGSEAVIPVFISPALTSTQCGASGLGTQGVPGVWLQDPHTIANGVRVIAHEIGHNLGLGHSGTLTSFERDDVQAYADTTDFMGVGGFYSCASRCVWVQAGIDAYNLDRLGVLPRAAIRTVRPGSSRNLTLRPVGQWQPGIRAAYLPGADGSMFVLDFRPATDFGGRLSEPSGPRAGVYLRHVLSGTDVATVALAVDAGPGQSMRIGHGKGDVMRLPDGSRITVLGVTRTAARVSVSR